MPHPKHHIDAVVAAVRRALTDDLRNEPWRGNANALAGHCYVASEALYHLLDGRKHGLRPMHVRHEDAPHWFLRDLNSGTNIDPTAEQFRSPVPYDDARGKGFLTSEPSARARVVIDRVKQDLGYRRAKLRKAIEDGEEIPVASVAVFNSKGHILFGKRGKEQKWNLPGGHIEEGESPEEAARREVLEEAGLKIKKLKYLGEALAGRKGNIRVHSFAASVEGSEEPTAEHDPDEEIDEFRWVDPKDIPDDIVENLYNKRDITLRLLGCEQHEAFEHPLEKHDSPEFKLWFEGSKVVGPDGKPLRVFHGTSKDQNFTSFRIGKRGAWFTSNPEDASGYATSNDSQNTKYDPMKGGFYSVNTTPRVIPAYLSIKNPYRPTPEDDKAHQRAENYQRFQQQWFDQLRAKGHDGVDFGNGNWVAFQPQQIKSVFNPVPTAKSPHLHKDESEAWHAGDGGTGRDTYLGAMTWGRGTGHFGTGTYFYSKREKIGPGHSDRPVKDLAPVLEGKRLHRPSDTVMAWNLHDHLKRVNNTVHDWVDALKNPGDDDYFQLPELSERADKIARGLAATAGIAGITKEHVERAVNSAAQDHLAGNLASESASTRLMRDLGFDGIDVRHLEDLDNGAYGSVVYQPRTLTKSELVEELQKAVLDPSLGYAISHHESDNEHGSKYKTTYVVAHDPTGTEVGFADFTHDDDGTLLPVATAVHEKHQRKGIASAMYAHAEKVTGKKVKPSESQTPEARAMWEANEKLKQFGKSESGVERALALKYNGIHHEHLRQGLHDADPFVRMAAARHPKLSEGLLPIALRDSDPGVVISALRNPAVRDFIKPEYLDLALGASEHAVKREIARHPATSSEQIARMWADVEEPDMFGDDDYVHMLVRHPNAPMGVLEDALHASLFNGPSKVNESLGVAAVSHPRVNARVVGSVINRYGMYNPAVREAAVRSPAISPGDLFRVLRNYQSDHKLRALALDNPNVTHEHIALAGHDPHPEVQQKAHEVALRAFKKSNGIPDEPLQKAPKPEHLKSVVRGIDDKGKHVVDHKSQMAAGVPAAVEPSVRLYSAGVTQAEKPTKGKLTGIGSGITRKTIFVVKGRTAHSGKISHAEENKIEADGRGDQPHLPGVDVFAAPPAAPPAYLPRDEKFMLKPYHEKIDQRLKKWMHAHIQGWAEVTNQALYHAGGIGHLHQKVHIVEHPVHAEDSFRASTYGTHEPMLAIHMAPGFENVEGGPDDPTEQTDHDTRKIALMDFLTNNLDRHTGNLLVSRDGRVLAVDHSRSFQYLNSSKGGLPKHIRPEDANDSLSTYLGARYGVGSGIASVLGAPNNKFRQRTLEQIDAYREGFEPAFEWWEKNGEHIRNALYDQLRHLKDERLKAHIRRNFDARARLLDQYAEFGIDNFGRDDWHEAEVPIYRPWEEDDR